MNQDPEQVARTLLEPDEFNELMRREARLYLEDGHLELDPTAHRRFWLEVLASIDRYTHAALAEMYACDLDTFVQHLMARSTLPPKTTRKAILAAFAQLLAKEDA